MISGSIYINVIDLYVYVYIIHVNKISLSIASRQRQQVCLNQYWSTKVPEAEVKFYVCHPGWAETEGVVSSIPDFYNTFKVCCKRSWYC